MKHFRNLVIALVSMMLTISSVCWASVNNHACCGESSTYTQAPVTPQHKACCVTPTVTDTKALQQKSARTDDVPLAVTTVLQREDLRALLAPIQQSLLQKAYVADQSGRHLELSVLLN